MPTAARRPDASDDGGPTLGRFVGLLFTAVTLLLCALLGVFHAGSRRTTLVASEQLMRQASRRVSERVDVHLGEAERLVAALETQAALGLVRRQGIAAALLAAIAAHPRVTDVTFTYGRAEGVWDRDAPPHEAGELRIAPGSAGQVAVARLPDGDGALLLREVRASAAGWRVERTRVAADGTRSPAPADATDAAVADPTTHPTFTTPARPAWRGRPLWSDLAFFEADGTLPEARRRRVVSVQKALWTPAEEFFGVVRVALDSTRLDALVRVAVDEQAAHDDHVVFLCDAFGRLVSRLGPADRFALLDRTGREDPEGDVRIVPAALPAPVAAVLAAPMMLAATPEVTVRHVEVDGVPYLASIAAVLGERTQGWRVGIVVPEAHYVGGLAATLRRVLAIAAVLIVALAAGLGIGLRALRRDLGRLLAETRRLRSFDFAPAASVPATFRDVRGAARSLEQAKTALRALGKYAPIDLVRELWDAHREPTLGAELRDVTLLFTDVAGFTTIAEVLAPDDLATALGSYLEAATRAIHASGGVIDKYTGDGVMALWNAPRTLPDHPARACEAALACVAATDALFASPAWRGRAPWRTRFGLHRAEVKVGHFGAPERMSFTAMGDGVNLASRLEGLGEHYGVAILASAAVVESARERFWFRRVDRVAVRGRRAGVDVFELLGPRRAAAPAPPIVAAYEAALARYFAGDFAAALAAFAALPDDPPSRVLAARCRDYLATPPGAGWNGVHSATRK